MIYKYKHGPQNEHPLCQAEASTCFGSFPHMVSLPLKTCAVLKIETELHPISRVKKASTSMFEREHLLQPPGAIHLAVPTCWVLSMPPFL